jgi:hypothetical protein
MQNPLLFLPTTTVSSTFRIISESHHPCPSRTSAHQVPRSQTITRKSFRIRYLFRNSKKSKRKHARNEVSVFFLSIFFDNPCSSQLFSFVTDDGRNNEGMHRDVNVMYMLIKFLCIIFRSLFIFPIMSRGLSPSRAQAGPRPWKRLRLQFRQA